MDAVPQQLQGRCATDCSVQHWRRLKVNMLSSSSALEVKMARGEIDPAQSDNMSVL